MFAVSLVLVATTLGYLGYEILTRGSKPPDLSLTLGEPQPGRAGYVIPVLITNHGDTTAQDVRVEVRLHGPGAEEQRAELEFPFVPRHSRRRGWVTFKTKPGVNARLEGIVLGYREE